MKENGSAYHTHERTFLYALLMANAGMMGAYTLNLRGGVFCNAQTANIVLMAVAFGKGQLLNGLYYLIPIFAYGFGAFVSEILPFSGEKIGAFRWETWLLLVEMLVLFFIGFLPLSLPHQIVQIAVNFIASMQYNTFRQAEGVKMATTFCTNHVRQIGVTLAAALRGGDGEARQRGLVHLKMLVSFLLGGILLTVFCPLLQEKAIWLALLPLTAGAGWLLFTDLKEGKLSSLSPESDAAQG